MLPLYLSSAVTNCVPVLPPWNKAIARDYWLKFVLSPGKTKSSRMTTVVLSILHYVSALPGLYPSC
jgi:hypothetical protein